MFEQRQPQLLFYIPIACVYDGGTLLEHSGLVLIRLEPHPDGTSILSSCRVTFFHAFPLILPRMLWSNFSLSFQEEYRGALTLHLSGVPPPLSPH